MRDLIPAPLKQTAWEAWKCHIKLLKLVTAHRLPHSSLDAIKILVFKSNQWLIVLYGADVLTPNTHWTLHLDLYIEWYSVLRGFWTFPQESILSLVKKSTRKMTNHKAVSYSCVSLFVLERLLSQILDPAVDVPVK